MDHEQIGTDGEHRPSGIRWDVDLAGGEPMVVIDVAADGQEIQVEFDPREYADLSVQQLVWAVKSAVWSEVYHEMIRIGMDPATTRRFVFAHTNQLHIGGHGVRALRVPRP